MRVSALSDIGVSRRENQDNYWSAVLSVGGEEHGVVCICDGMGGLKDGGLASQIVTRKVKEYLCSNANFEDLLPQLVEANTEIYKQSKQNGAMMGTTCTVICCRNGRYGVYHIGDSRAYHFSSGVLKLLTEDHSAVKQFGISRTKQPDVWNKYKNKLTKCIGVTPKIYPDYYQGTYEEGDFFLLCSDGFWHYLEDHPEVSEIDPQSFGKLVNSCIEDGETDNITVCMLQV